MARAPLDIAVGVVADSRGRLLAARRRPESASGGYWEFPGGKREPGESIAQCLARELAEEIGIGVGQTEPVIRFDHDYGPRPVRLHVWRVTRWSGRAYGREGQTTRWVRRDELGDFHWLPGASVIFNALFLPRRYIITPGVAARGERAWRAGLQAVLAGGAQLLRLRDPDLDDNAYRALARVAVAQARATGARVLVDRDPGMAAQLGAHGLHWPARRLVGHGRPRLAAGRLLAVSAHNSAELADAARLGADFAVLSPVAATPGHPDARPLGWAGFARARGEHALAVYALGGLGSRDIETALAHNGQGVAAIRGFWNHGGPADLSQ